MSEIDARTWWQGLTQRYSGRRIEFALDGEVREFTLPAELFDSVADNLIENALNKASEAQAITVRVIFSAEMRGTLTVCDDGAAISKNVVSQLFESAVTSHTGFGVGLYQSSRLATQSGYRLALVANSAGKVCFVLSGESAAGAATGERQVA